jgi:hypothetical protein
MLNSVAERRSSWSRKNRRMVSTCSTLASSGSRSRRWVGLSICLTGLLGRLKSRTARFITPGAPRACSRSSPYRSPPVRGRGEALDNARPQPCQRKFAEPRDDSQLEVDRVALLGRKRHPALGVVGPPLAVDVVPQRDLIGKQRRGRRSAPGAERAGQTRQRPPRGRMSASGSPRYAHPGASARARQSRRRRCVSDGRSRSPLLPSLSTHASARRVRIAQGAGRSRRAPGRVSGAA